jgi:hypothetical protein
VIEMTPLMLTENGRVELVVRAAVSYQEILERLEHAETLAVIRKDMRQFKRGGRHPTLSR